MSKKIETVLRIVAIVSLILGAWALTLNQLSAFVENGKEAKLTQAISECVAFDAPHAIIVEGVAYCYVTFNGTEQLAPLSYLQERYGDTQASE